MTRFILISICLLTAYLCSAQYQTGHSLHSPYSLAEYYSHEVSVSTSLVRLQTEGTWSYNVRGQYVYYLDSSGFGVGAAYERIFDDHQHQTIGAVLSYKPMPPLTINLSPGATWTNEKNSDVNISAHLDSYYEWAWRNIHFGPKIEFAYEFNDVHWGIGLQTGMGF